MEISTSLNVYNEREQDYKKVLQRAYNCGFRCFDFNPGDYVNQEENFYTSENWRENLKEIKAFADALGVKFTQSHAYCFVMPEPEDVEYQTKKTIEASGIVGVPWVVMHPWITGLEDKDAILKENVRRFEPYMEYAKIWNLGIAIENTPGKRFWFGEKHTSEAFFRADDLIRLVDVLNEKYDNVGICWDTGHAHLSMESQYDDLMKIGKRLKVLHIADNDGQSDDHQPPFLGYVNWKEIMKALKEIGYDGTFNFETHNFTRCMPDELVDDAVKMMYKIGDFITNNY